MVSRHGELNGQEHFLFFYRKLHAVINPIFPFYFLLALHMELAHVSLFMCLCEKDREEVSKKTWMLLFFTYSVEKDSISPFGDTFSQISCRVE